MTTIKTLTAVAAGALALSATGAAQAQTPYTSTPYGQTQTPQDAFGAILGALFGTNQSLDSEWSRAVVRSAPAAPSSTPAFRPVCETAPFPAGRPAASPPTIRPWSSWRPATPPTGV